MHVYGFGALLDKRPGKQQIKLVDIVTYLGSCCTPELQNMTRIILLATLLLLASIGADAAEVRIDNQVLDSIGAFGEAGNGSASANYGGPTTIFTEMNFLGRWRRVLDDSRLDEAFFQITNVTQGYDFSVQIATDEEGDFDDSTSVTIVTTPQLLVFAQQDDEFRFEAFEDFDDGPGADARWDILTRLVLREHAGGIGSPPTPLIDLGSFNAGAMSIDTLGSTMDTSIALYTIDGTLLAQSDDEFDDNRFFGDDEFASLINADLAPGDYVIALGGALTEYGDGFAIPSNADVFELSEGNFALNLNDDGVAFGRLEGEGRMQSYRFTVVAAVPEPTLFPLLLLTVGGLATALRWRANC